MDGKKRMGAFFLACGLVLTMLFGAVPVSAAGWSEAGKIVGGSLLTTEPEVQDTKTILTRGNYLACGTADLSNLGNRVLGIAGSTTCHSVCDTVICNMYLEYLDEETGAWNSYEYWNSSDTGVYSHTVYYELEVEGGHWYRLCGGHIAIKNQNIESTTTMTDGIWVD